MITSKEILSELGLKNIKTLTRWHKQYKLVPPPVIKTHPNGRGKIAYWNEEDLPLFKYVKSKFDEGLKATEIKASIGLRDIKEHNKFLNYTESMKNFISNLIEGFKDEPKKLFYNIYEDVIRALHKSELTVKKKKEIYSFLVHKDTLFKILLDLSNGYNPVLFISGKENYILIDCLISDLLSEDEFTDISFIYPLKNSIVNFFNKISKGKINFKVDKFPIQSIEIKKENGRILQVPYIRTSLNFGGFDLMRQLTVVVWEGGEDNPNNEEN